MYHGLQVKQLIEGLVARNPKHTREIRAALLP